jgi:hypothetical protein
MTDRTRANVERAAAGRPRKIKTAEQAQALCSAYFVLCKKENRPLTMCGLARALGFSTRLSLMGNAARADPVGQVLADALAQVEEGYESNLHRNIPTGSIFALKNMGWADRQEVEHSGDVTVTMVDFKDAESKGFNPDGTRKQAK